MRLLEYYERFGTLSMRDLESILIRYETMRDLELIFQKSYLLLIPIFSYLPIHSILLIFANG